MANRVLRDWTQSERINNLSESAEVFFTRLIMKVDDYGCYYGNFKLLKSALYPLREISNIDVERNLNECEENGLIIRYIVDNKQYVMIKDFGQRLRAMRNKFPLPIDSNTPSSVSNPPPETETKPKRNESEFEGNKNILDVYFKDLKTCSYLDSILIDNKLTRENLEKLIPVFQKKANVEYKQFTDLVNHFKKWVPIYLNDSNNSEVFKTKKPNKTFN